MFPGNDDCNLLKPLVIYDFKIMIKVCIYITAPPSMWTDSVCSRIGGGTTLSDATEDIKFDVFVKNLLIKIHYIIFGHSL